MTQWYKIIINAVAFVAVFGVAIVDQNKLYQGFYGIVGSLFLGNALAWLDVEYNGKDIINKKGGLN